MDNLLLILVVVLALLVGGLVHTLWLQSKDLKSIKRIYNDAMTLADRTFNTIARLENIDIKKYIDIAHKELSDEKKGGEKNG